VLTDLAEAKAIVEHNLEQNMTDRNNITFQELDWEQDLPELLQKPDTQIDLVVAADCTYNPDSRWAYLLIVGSNLTMLQSCFNQHIAQDSEDITSRCSCYSYEITAL
jgi:hypothetical protein